MFKKVSKPWGWYQVLTTGKRHKVKTLYVDINEELSVQLHYHRDEHWIVVEGTIEVLLDNKTYILSENNSIFIPRGEKHSIRNTGKVPATIIEVQYGSYLEEDDIIRYSDKYDR